MAELEKIKGLKGDIRGLNVTNEFTPISSSNGEGEFRDLDTDEVVGGHRARHGGRRRRVTKRDYLDEAQAESVANLVVVIGTRTTTILAGPR